MGHVRENLKDAQGDELLMSDILGAPEDDPCLWWWWLWWSLNDDPQTPTDYKMT